MYEREEANKELITLVEKENIRIVGMNEEKFSVAQTVEDFLKVLSNSIKKQIKVSAMLDFLKVSVFKGTDQSKLQ